MEHCVICLSMLTHPAREDGGSTTFECRRCGSLRVTGTAVAVLQSAEATGVKRDAMSHFARRWVRPAGYSLTIDNDTVMRWLRDATLASPQEQEENLVLWLGSNRGPDWDPARFHLVAHEELASIVGGRSEVDAMLFLFDHASMASMVVENRRTNTAQERARSGVFELRLTFPGWRRYQDLQRARSDSRRGFMAMAFGDQIVDQAYTECFVLAAQDAGFKLRRLDEGQGAGLIDDQLRVAIRTCKFLIADLTTGNQGAYWEAGFAEGLGRPVIYVCEKTKFTDEETRPHFDTNHMNTVLWTIDDLPDARRRLAATIRNTFPDDATMLSSDA